ncbi:MAG: hypothetical protein ACKOE2_16095 [Actinomycetales bacterium]
MAAFIVGFIWCGPKTFYSPAAAGRCPRGTDPHARAKMQGQHDGFVKILCRRGSRINAGAVIVGANASELIHGLTVAVDNKLTVDELALTFTVYPSLSGSIAEAARRLHVAQD